MHKQAFARVEKKSGKIRSGSTPRPRKFPALQKKDEKEDVPRRGLQLSVEEIISKSASHLSQLRALDGLVALKCERKESKDEFIEVVTEAAARRQAFRDSLAGSLMRSLFKADHPYRTRLGFPGFFATNASGVLNQVYNPNQLSTTTEWSSIDALFDEYFIHTMALHYYPVNATPGGIPSAAAHNYGQSTFLGNAAPLYLSCGLQAVSIFGSNSAYATATQMIASPTLQTFMSSKQWTYRWRNNTSFSPHGQALDVSSQVLGWQGWAPILSSTKYGGLMQVRTVNDVVFGDGSVAYTLGTFNIIFDVSFRSRS